MILEVLTKDSGPGLVLCLHAKRSGLKLTLADTFPGLKAKIKKLTTTQSAVKT